MLSGRSLVKKERGEEMPLLDKIFPPKKIIKVHLVGAIDNFSLRMRMFYEMNPAESHVVFPTNIENTESLIFVGYLSTKSAECLVEMKKKFSHLTSLVWILDQSYKKFYDEKDLKRIKKQLGVKDVIWFDEFSSSFLKNLGKVV